MSMGLLLWTGLSRCIIIAEARDFAEKDETPAKKKILLEVAMKVVRTGEVPEVPADSPLMTGGEVTRQNFVEPDASNNFSFAIVNFSRGSRNFFHSHTSDQILIITSGIGIVATDAEQHEVTVGDVILIPAGEKHWHGARKESYMSHITVTEKGSGTTQLEH